MQVKGIVDECFNDYKVPAMLIIAPSCTFKCDIENGCNICQNILLNKVSVIDINKDEIIKRYLNNSITRAIIFGGLEPFDSPMDLSSFIDCLRREYGCNDPVVIYTGYTEHEIKHGKFGPAPQDISKTFIKTILSYPNIIIKYGRFRPNQSAHYDEILGVQLASNNQYAKEYNHENSD